MLRMITMAVDGMLIFILTMSAVIRMLTVLEAVGLVVNSCTMLDPLVAGNWLRTIVTCIFVSGLLVRLLVARRMFWASLGAGKLSLVRLLGRLLLGLNVVLLLTCGYMMQIPWLVDILLSICL